MNRLIIVSISMIVTLTWSWISEGAEWQSRGIGGGGALYSISLSPFDTEVIYMATDMGTTFRSGDFGSHWQGVPFQRLVGGVNSEVRFTSDPQILYSLDLSNDLRTPVKSVDGGLSWQALSGDPTFQEAFQLFVDPDSTQRILLNSWQRLYFSDDGGSNFSEVYVSSDSGAGLHLAGVFWDGNDIYVASNSGLITSTNGGTSFGVLSLSGIPTDERIVGFAGAKEGPTTRFFITTLNVADVWNGMTGAEAYGFEGVYRLDVGDSGWTSSTSGLPAGSRPYFVGMTLDEVDVAWIAGGSDSGFPTVFRATSSGGWSWSSVFQTSNNANISTGWAGSSGDLEWWWPELALGFGVSPVDPNRAVIADYGFVHFTSDGGASWHQGYVEGVDENPPGNPTPEGSSYEGVGLQQTSVWWLHWPSANTMLAAFTDIAGTRSTDGGVKWTSNRSHGIDENSLYHIVEHPNGTLYGATSSVHDLYQSTYLEDSRIDGGDGRVVVSTDQGANWTTLHDFGHPVIWLALDPNDSEKLYASVVHSSDGDIYRTSDLSSGSGASWSRLASPPRTEGHPFNIQVLNDGALLASYSGRRDGGGAFTTSSGVFLSTNGGTSWLDRSDSGQQRWTKDVVVDPHDPLQNTWYATVFSHWGSAPNEVGGVYRTTNRGQSWQRISDLYRVNSLTVNPGNSSEAYVTTEVQGLWRTENLTAPNPDFQAMNDYPFGQPMRIFFNPFDTIEIWATSFGDGLRVRMPQEPIFSDGFESGDLSAWSATQP